MPRARLALALLPLGASLLACAGLGWGPVAVTDVDKAVPFTAAELAVTHGTPVDPALETWSMERLPEGEYDLDYEFDNTDGDPVVLLISSLSKNKDAGSAKQSFAAIKAGLAIGFAGEDMQRTERPELCSLGDICICEELASGGIPVGTQCIVRDGANVALVQMVGALWTEAGEVDQALGPMMARMANWNPRQKPE
jgi:hypothetical protein